MDAPSKRSRTKSHLSKPNAKRSNTFPIDVGRTAPDGSLLDSIAALAAEKRSKFSTSSSSDDSSSSGVESLSPSSELLVSNLSPSASSSSLPPTIEPLPVLLYLLRHISNLSTELVDSYYQLLTDLGKSTLIDLLNTHKSDLTKGGIPSEIASALISFASNPQLFNPNPFAANDESPSSSPSWMLIELAPSPEKPSKLIPVLTPDALAHNFRFRPDFHIPYISILGDCGEGKSFLLNQLGLFYPPQAPEQKPFSVSELFSPMTSGINVYYSGHFSGVPTFPLIGLLDYEAPNNTTLPSQAVRFAQGKPIQELPSCSARSKAVSRYFPQLACLLSDAIIVVSSGHLQSDSTFSKLCEIASANILDIEDGLRPVLVLVQNRAVCTYGSVWDIDLITTEFLQRHDPHHQLRSMFYEVWVVRLPEMIEPFVNVFQSVIRELRARLVKSFLEKKSFLTRYNRTITNKVWHHLLHGCIHSLIKRRRSSHSRLNTHRLIDPFYQSDDAITDHLICYWNALVHPPHCFSLPHFVACRRFLFLTLARLLATYLTSKGIFDIQDISSFARCRPFLSLPVFRLWHFIDARAPCQARPSGWQRLASSTPEGYFCCRLRVNHLSSHRTRSKVLISESDQLHRGLYPHLSKHRFTQDGVFYEWSGAFVSGFPEKPKSSSKAAESDTADPFTTSRGAHEYIEHQVLILAENGPSRPLPSTELRWALETQGITHLNISTDPCADDVTCIACFTTPTGIPAWTIPATPVQLDYLPLCPTCLPAFSQLSS